MVIAVVGAGMIGAAAARHLAQAGHQVVLVGPPEPQDKIRHNGVFASHYDEGRITRALDPWPFWSRVSRASIARYRQIEADSRVLFFHEVGTVLAGDKTSPYITRLCDVQKQDDIPCESLQDAALASRFPFFRFGDGTLALHETQGAGYINPRALVRAQISLARKAGARFLPDTVLGLDETADGVSIRTDQGTVLVNQVLVAAGGFANSVLATPLPLTVFARTVVLMEIDTAEAARLSAMPSLIWLEPDGNDPYLLPPIRYPDGRTYLKMGGDVVDVVLPDTAATKDWFRSGGNPAVGQMLEAQVRARMPDLRIISRHVQPCVTTFTPQNIPALERLSPRLSVAVGGCGRAAKCSDELGRLGAELALGRTLPAWALDAALPN
ncbi:FAD-dependent oxidoreductase [Seohaeicola saemankumensis]|uniref:FAD-dependent oxidoreductase n=1 Tax=Seohaeicola saemankumensis TaxID=481181 RepID=UPI001E37439F|nr:FAD-dependent oxidoreductase [Seohaeicola saemankumensis]MCD1625276.1 FAD-dependent oxidoreductase [Seohaeicola saemankumensis]